MVVAVWGGRRWVVEVLGPGDTAPVMFIGDVCSHAVEAVILVRAGRTFVPKASFYGCFATPASMSARSGSSAKGVVGSGRHPGT